MWLKNVKNIFSVPSSIVARLSIFYALATFVLLSLISFFLYCTMVGILYQNDHQFLSDKIAVIKYLLKVKDSDQSALKHEITDVPFVTANSIYHYSIRIINHNNEIVMETPGMGTRIGDTHFFQKNNNRVSKHSEWFHAPNGEKYLLSEQSFQFGKNPEDVWMIQAALNVSFQHELMAVYKLRAITVLVIGEIFAVLLGFFIAKRGMRKLEDLIDTTKNITATSLNKRLETQNWPKELRTLGKAFNQMLDRMENAFSHLMQFSDDLAHELRTPINNMMIETEVALTRTLSNSEYTAILSSNLEELQRITNIIENILFLARAENPQLDLKKTQLKLEDEIKLICEFYEAMAEDKNIKIKIQGQAELMANQVMFRRLISNLLSNALKYSTHNTEINFNIQDNENNISVVLQDQGVGISQEHLPHILQRFYRVDPSRSQANGSMGLGLAIVKSIVQIHNGILSILSDEGKGTTICLEFPK